MLLGVTAGSRRRGREGEERGVREGRERGKEGKRGGERCHAPEEVAAARARAHSRELLYAGVDEGAVVVQLTTLLRHEQRPAYSTMAMKY